MFPALRNELFAYCMLGLLDGSQQIIPKSQVYVPISIVLTQDICQIQICIALFPNIFYYFIQMN